MRQCLGKQKKLKTNTQKPIAVDRLFQILRLSGYFVAHHFSVDTPALFALICDHK